MFLKGIIWFQYCQTPTAIKKLISKFPKKNYGKPIQQKQSHFFA
jgi:hypothetical protein